MFCEKCGTKNNKDSKFCENCGHKLEIETSKPRKKDSKYDKILATYKNMSKKTKVVMAVVLIIAVILIIFLAILLNNPVKRVEDYLDNYYSNGASTKELVNIGNIIKANKDDSKILESIKKSHHNAVSKWVKNFNISYDSIDSLDNNYARVKNAIDNLYKYFNGLDYVIDYELYNKHITDLNEIYTSKSNYLLGKKSEQNNKTYEAYYYYQKVIKEDSYYNEASNYVNEYVKEEMMHIKEKMTSYIPKDGTNKEILDGYLEALKYLQDNKISNNIDLSGTIEYTNLYNEITKKVVEYVKIVVGELKSDEADSVLEILNNVLKYLLKDSTEYKEIETKIKEYQDMQPISLLEKRKITDSSNIEVKTYSFNIGNNEYKNGISFTLNDESKQIAYHINKEYKTFKSKIVLSPEWNNNCSGYFVFYGDNNELYKTDVITKLSDLKSDINLDVTNINDLKIEFVTSSKSVVTSMFNIYLVEPYLYK